MTDFMIIMYMLISGVTRPEHFIAELTRIGEAFYVSLNVSSVITNFPRYFTARFTQEPSVNLFS